MSGPIARLHRAISQFMLDTHTDEHGYEEFDFAGGNESYKYRFANRIRHVYEVRAHSTRMAGRLDHALQCTRARLRDSTHVKHWIKRAVAALPCGSFR